jgi:hypothetical protein
LEVEGVVPAAADAGFLPASLTKLILVMEDGKWSSAEAWYEQEAERAVLQAWLDCGPLPRLQQLQLWNFAWEEEFVRYHDPQLDFSGLSELRDLRYICSSPDPGVKRGYRAPGFISQLTCLELLQLGMLQNRYPFHGPYLDFFGEEYDMAAADILATCTQLRSLGHVSLPEVSFEVCFLHLSSLQLVVGHQLSVLLNPSCFPSLQHLVVECNRVTPSMVECLAQLSALTCLKLSSGEIFFNSEVSMGGWCGVEALGHSLLQLHRLELVSCFGSTGRMVDQNPLVMPNLSTFTQLKQLQLACALNPRKALPAQPSPADFLASLSGLTQLEQLEVLGYSSVTSGLLTDLVTCLPELRALEVGLCRHTSLVHARVAREAASGVSGGGVELLPVHQGFAQASRACERLRPGLRVQVGYTPQWLP